MQLIDRELVQHLLEEARHSARGRMNHDFHASFAENPSRLLNALIRGTYVTPHRHRNPPKPETFIVLEGRLAFFEFDDEGNITRSEILGPGERVLGIDIGPGIWHSMAALSPQVMCFEVKPGPYDPASDKEFAPWAPREGDPGAPEYLARLLRPYEPLC